jgi:hypothetical protein
MPTWEELNTELSQIMKRKEYKLFLPLLERLQTMVNAQYGTSDIVGGILEIIKHIQEDVRKGADPQELAEQVASGFIQPRWNVAGNVNQAQRDIIITIFNQTLPEIKQQAPQPGIPVPVILLVMTDSEADQLDTGNAFTGYSQNLAQQFNKFKKLLFPNWKNNYGKTPEDWKPFANNPATIAEVVKQALGYIQGYSKPLVPRFIDIRTLNDGDIGMRLKLKRLRENGCIVIMDDISTWHPVIQLSYRGSLLDAYPNVHIVKVAPNQSAVTFQQTLICFPQTIIDLEFHKRLTLDIDDENCGENPPNLTVWLTTHIGRLVKVKGDIWEQMYK